MLPAHYQKDKPGYFCRFTFGQFFTLLVLEVFTLFFIFYLGARYGRSLLGIETPPTLAESKGLPEVKVTDPNVVVTTSDPEIKELAKDILEQAPTADLKQRVAEMLQESGEKRTTDQKKGTTDYGLRTTDKEKRTTDQGLGTRDRKPETEEPHKVITQVEPVIRTGPKAPFAIQVGAYTNP
ncbi:MAG: hypothetical protein HY609_02135, partial [Deltaproteobacteria bacterium]|nr:hypothetical protein [Deltaproteobacteria bacterium]